MAKIVWVKAELRHIGGEPVANFYKPSGGTEYQLADEMLFYTEEVHVVQQDPPATGYREEVADHIAARYGKARHKADHGNTPWGFVAHEMQALAKDLDIQHLLTGGETEDGMAHKDEGPKTRRMREMREQQVAEQKRQAKQGTTGKDEKMAKKRAKKPEIEDGQILWVPVQVWTDDEELYGLLHDETTGEPWDDDEGIVWLERFRWMKAEGNPEATAAQKKRRSKKLPKVEDEEVVYVPGAAYTDDGLYMMLLDADTGIETEDEDEAVYLDGIVYSTEPPEAEEDEPEPEPEPDPKPQRRRKRRTESAPDFEPPAAEKPARKGRTKKEPEPETVWVQGSAVGTRIRFVDNETGEPDTSEMDLNGFRWTKDAFNSNEFKKHTEKVVAQAYNELWVGVNTVEIETQPYVVAQNKMREIAEELELDIDFDGIDKEAQQAQHKTKTRKTKTRKNNNTHEMATNRVEMPEEEEEADPEEGKKKGTKSAPAQRQPRARKAAAKAPTQPEPEEDGELDIDELDDDEDGE